MSTAKRIKVIAKRVPQTDPKTHRFVLVGREPMMMEVENVRYVKTNVKLASPRLVIVKFARETEFLPQIAYVLNRSSRKIKSHAQIAQISVQHVLARRIIA